MTTEYDDSVHQAVAKEEARRKHVLMMYTAWLIVPLGLSAYALSKAPTEVQTLVARVSPGVEQKVGTSVTNEVVKRSQPIIDARVSQAINATEARFQSEITALQNRDREALAIASTAEPRLNELSTLLEQTRASINALGEAQVRVKNEIANGQAATTALSTRMNDLDTRVSNLDAHILQESDARTAMNNELRTVRAKLDEAVAAANASKDTVRALSSQLATINREMKDLRIRAKVLEGPRTEVH